jgi:intracellular sulfur oxidation DsrE/DsrF family protein
MTFYLSSVVGRRAALLGVGQAAAVMASLDTTGAAFATPPQTVAGHAAGLLVQFGQRLAVLPRRREFRSIPFMVSGPHEWDHEAAAEVLSYKYRALQVWDNSDLSGPCLSLMREAINGQVFAHGNRDFLAVSATHGSAHLSLFSQAAWDEHNLALLTDGRFASNSFIREKPGASLADDLQNQDGFYGPSNNNIVSLQLRGVVFLACHDSINAIARQLHSRNGVPADIIAANLTNSLIPNVVLVPSVVAFLVELQSVGFTYFKGS